MIHDLTAYPLIAARPAVRPVARQDDTADPGTRHGHMSACGTGRPEGGAPAASPPLGDPTAASDLARLAQRYAQAARMASGKRG